MLEKWKSAVYKGKSFGPLSTDLSKAVNLSHELLLAKLHAYGFNIAALRLIHSYLKKQMADNKDKYAIQLLGRNCIWGTIRIYSRTFAVQHFSV